MANSSKGDIVTLIGIKKSKFVNDDGDSVKYARLYASFPERGVTGCACAEFKLDYTIADKLKKKLGCKIKLEFNRYGKVSNATEVSDDDDIDDEDDNGDDDYDFTDDDAPPFGDDE